MDRLWWCVVIAAVVVLGLLVVMSTFSQEENDVVMDCILLCRYVKEAGANLSQGPCLSDGNPEWKHTDWVCDVAHSPRQPVDNLPENQCNEFRSGRAHHFVEITPECEFIRAV